MGRRMGYHYSPCNRTGAGTGIALILVCVVIAIRFGHTIIQGVIQALIYLGIGVGIGTAILAVVMGYWTIEGRKAERAYVEAKGRRQARCNFDSGELSAADKRVILLVKEWLALPLADQVSPEWDFFTGITDETRESAKLEIERMKDNAHRHR
jgi:hypothetical protein